MGGGGDAQPFCPAFAFRANPPLPPPPPKKNPQNPSRGLEHEPAMASDSEAAAHSTLTSTTVEDGGAHESKQEHLNGAVGTPTVGQEEEIIGPGPAPAKQRRKRPLQFEQAFLDALPSAAMCALSTLAIWIVSPVA
jgi:hypothetical protein